MIRSWKFAEPHCGQLRNFCISLLFASKFLDACAEVPEPTAPQLPQLCIAEPHAIKEFELCEAAICFSLVTRECQTFPQTAHCL